MAQNTGGITTHMLLNAATAPLQRELLAICRGGRFLAAWASVNGIPLGDRVDLRGELERGIRARHLRTQILLINPNAALYWGWLIGDEMKDEPGFRQRVLADQLRRQDEQLERAEAQSLYGAEHGNRGAAQ